MRGPVRLPLAVAALVLFWLGAAPTANAQFYTWNATTSGNWSNGANWNVGTPPPSAASTELTFTATGATSYTATNDIANPFLMRRLVLDNEGTGTITIAPAAGGGAITFTGVGPSLENFANGAVTVSTPINLAADTLFTGFSTGTATFTGTVNDGGGGFGLNTAMSTTWLFTSSGSSSLDFLRVGWGTTQITAGTWTLTNATTADATAAFMVGNTSGQSASFTLSGGAMLSTAGNMSIGDIANSTGTALITGSGTTVTATGTSTGRLTVGNSGTGSLTISDGAAVNTRFGVIGRNAGSNGTVIVDGTGSQWSTISTLTVGDSGSGSLTVQGGGTVSPGSLVVVNGSASTGSVLVTGTGSQLVTTGAGDIITQLGGSLAVASGGLVSGNDVQIGRFGATATATVDAGTLTVRNTLIVGNGGSAGLTISNGGVVTVASNGFVGTAATNVGTITVTGVNSKLTMTSSGTFLVFGGGSGAGRGDLTVENGGALSSAGLQLTFAQDSGSTSTSLVDAGSVSVTGTLVVGQAGTASLTVQNGGTVTAGATSIGSNSTATGTLTVTGVGSVLTSTGVIKLGGSGTTPGGTATLTVQSGASASAGGLITLFGGAAVNVNAGSLSVGGLTQGTASSIGNINLSNGGTLTITDGLAATYAGVIGGAGSLTKTGSGTQTLTGVNTYSGNTNINGGTLVLSGAGSIAASPTITVAPSATLDVGGVTGGFALLSGQTLCGGGTVAGAVTAASGSSIAAGTAAGTDKLTISGNLTLSSGSTLAARLAGNVAGTTYDQVAIAGSGAITLTGSTLTVTGTYTPLSTDVLTIILNGPNSSVNGTFANAPVPGDPQGRIDLGGYYANISYLGSAGTISGGNDVVIYNVVPVPEPFSILATSAMAGLILGSIRRSRSPGTSTKS